MDRPLFFIHIPKTAGTSFRSLLSEVFPNRPLVEMPLREEGRKAAAARFGSEDLVVGHVGYELAARFPVRPVTFTFLREPVDRALSNFSFLQNHPPSVPGVAEDESDFSAAAGMTLGEFLRESPEAASRHLGNLHTWFLTRDGLAPRGDLRSLGRGDLEKAKRNLRSLDAFGLVERMPESLLTILSALRVPVAFLEKMPLENRQGSRLLRADLDGATEQALNEACSLDAELYAFAAGLFEERLAALRLWASSWLPEFWLLSSNGVVSTERALAATREEVFARLLDERSDREATLAEVRTQAFEARATLISAEERLRQQDASLARTHGFLEASEQARQRIAEALEESESDRRHVRAMLEETAGLIGSIRRSSAWRSIEVFRGLIGRRWNI